MTEAIAFLSSFVVFPGTRNFMEIIFSKDVVPDLLRTSYIQLLYKSYSGLSTNAIFA